MKIVATPAGGKKLAIAVNGFIVQTDLAVEKGGQNTAPTPYELFLSSIAACAAIYAVNFCQQRELSTEDLEIVETWERDEAGHKLVKVDLQVSLPEGFPTKYRNAILKAIELCPVKRALAEAPAVSVRLCD